VADAVALCASPAEASCAARMARVWLMLSYLPFASVVPCLQ